MKANLRRLLWGLALTVASLVVLGGVAVSSTLARMPAPLSYSDGSLSWVWGLAMIAGMVALPTAVSIVHLLRKRRKKASGGEAQVIPLHAESVERSQSKRKAA
jgi:hypothetical protein